MNQLSLTFSGMDAVGVPGTIIGSRRVFTREVPL
jgi:hypothetical protein